MCGRTVEKEEAHQNKYAAQCEDQGEFASLENENRYVHHGDDEKEAAGRQAHAEASQSLTVGLWKSGERLA